MVAGDLPGTFRLQSKLVVVVKSEVDGGPLAYSIQHNKPGPQPARRRHNTLLGALLEASNGNHSMIKGLLAAYSASKVMKPAPVCATGSKQGEEASAHGLPPGAAAASSSPGPSSPAKRSITSTQIPELMQRQLKAEQRQVVIAAATRSLADWDPVDYFGAAALEEAASDNNSPLEFPAGVVKTAAAAAADAVLKWNAEHPDVAFIPTPPGSPAVGAGSPSAAAAAFPSWSASEQAAMPPGSPGTAGGEDAEPDTTKRPRWTPPRLQPGFAASSSSTRQAVDLDMLDVGGCSGSQSLEGMTGAASAGLQFGAPTGSSSHSPFSAGVPLPTFDLRALAGSSGLSGASSSPPRSPTATSAASNNLQSAGRQGSRLNPAHQRMPPSPCQSPAGGLMHPAAAVDYIAAPYLASPGRGGPHGGSNNNMALVGSPAAAAAAQALEGMNLHVFRDQGSAASPSRGQPGRQRLLPSSSSCFAVGSAPETSPPAPQPQTLSCLGPLGGSTASPRASNPPAPGFGPAAAENRSVAAMAGWPLAQLATAGNIAPGAYAAGAPPHQHFARSCSEAGQHMDVEMKDILQLEGQAGPQANCQGLAQAITPAAAVGLLEMLLQCLQANMHPGPGIGIPTASMCRPSAGPLPSPHNSCGAGDISRCQPASSPGPLGPHEVLQLQHLLQAPKRGLYTQVFGGGQQQHNILVQNLGGNAGQQQQQQQQPQNLAGVLARLAAVARVLPAGPGQPAAGGAGGAGDQQGPAAAGGGASAAGGGASAAGGGASAAGGGAPPAGGGAPPAGGGASAAGGGAPAAGGGAPAAGGGAPAAGVGAPAAVATPQLVALASQDSAVQAVLQQAVHLIQQETDVRQLWHKLSAALEDLQSNQVALLSGLEGVAGMALSARQALAAHTAGAPQPCQDFLPGVHMQFQPCYPNELLTLGLDAISVLLASALSIGFVVHRAGGDATGMMREILDAVQDRDEQRERAGLERQGLRLAAVFDASGTLPAPSMIAVDVVEEVGAGGFGVVCRCQVQQSGVWQPDEFMVKFLTNAQCVTRDSLRVVPRALQDCLREATAPSSVGSSSSCLAEALFAGALLIPVQDGVLSGQQLQECRDVLSEGATLAQVKLACSSSSTSLQEAVALTPTFEDSDAWFMMVPFILFKAYDGDLWHLLQHRGTLDFEEAVVLLTQLMNGLSHLHSSCIIHKDVKSSNCLLSARDFALGTDFKQRSLLASSCFLADFGLCVRVGGDCSGSGTPDLRAPETEARLAQDGKVDVWGAALVLLECLFGLRATAIWTTPIANATRQLGGVTIPDRLVYDARCVKELAAVNGGKLRFDIGDAEQQELVEFFEHTLAFDPAQRWNTHQVLHSLLLARGRQLLERLKTAGPEREQLLSDCLDRLQEEFPDLTN